VLCHMLEVVPDRIDAARVGRALLNRVHDHVGIKLARTSAVLPRPAISYSKARRTISTFSRDIAYQYRAGRAARG
jgi:hypothetical protein